MSKTDPPAFTTAEDDPFASVEADIAGLHEKEEPDADAARSEAPPFPALRFYHPSVFHTEHRAVRPHTERPERMTAADEGVAAVLAEFRRGEDFLDGGVPVGDTEAFMGLLRSIYPDVNAYLARIRDMGAEASDDGETFCTPGTLAASVAAAATAAHAAAEVVARSAAHAFALVRPPGNRSGRGPPSGACFINNAVVAARAALRALRADGTANPRVAILDLDVHHGEGTQELTYDSPDLLYLSIHEAGGSGGKWQADRTGATCDASNLNFPITASKSGRDDVYFTILLMGILPALEDFDPDLVVVSLGFGACEGEESGFSVSPLALADMVERVADTYPSVVLTEGGGRDLGNVSKVCAGVARRLITQDEEKHFSRGLQAFLEGLSEAVPMDGVAITLATLEAALKRWNHGPRLAEAAASLQAEVERHR